MRRVTTQIIRSSAGTIVLGMSLLIHFSIAMQALYRHPFLHLRRWQQLQIISGITMIVLLIPHAVEIRGIHMGFNIDTSYPLILQHLWNDSLDALLQICLVIVTWLHICIGLHYWLKTKSWYKKNLFWMYAIAILWPSLAVIGFIQSGYEAFDYDVIEPDNPDIAGLIESVETSLVWFVIGMSAFMMSLKWLQTVFIRTTRACTIFIADYQVKTRAGQTILNGLRFADYPHASVCGGRARCTTCRVRVNQGMENLQPIGKLESLALGQINAPPGVRLACQANIIGDVNITALLPADAGVKHALPFGGISGEEREIVVMFVDLRESTKLSENKLPYDILYLLNQFFNQMSESLKQTKGHYAQFAGDGLMALYGLDTDSKTACKQALYGVEDMLRRLENLNLRLKPDLQKPLKIGIGLHFGEAIVGHMGPPKSPNHSAIGDTVNTAARLEAKTKSLNCLAVISTQLISHCNADDSRLEHHTITLRGRKNHMDVVCIHTVAELESLIDSIDTPAGTGMTSKTTEIK